MEVVTVETGAFKNMVGMFETILKTVSSQSEELKHLKDNRLMSVEEVAGYTGFSTKWVHQRKALIGFFQEGKDVKIYKADLDAYITKNFIKRKY